MLLRTLFLLAATALPAWAQDVALVTPNGTATVTRAALDAMPQATATLRFGNPPAPHSFQGPPLWTVLTQSHAIDPARHAAVPRQTLTIQGTDRYQAILALGELSPEFEAKPAILALSMDGTALPLPRAIVPGDGRAGRSVRDVATLTLEEKQK